jgi:hypothetical protein
VAIAVVCVPVWGARADTYTLTEFTEQAFIEALSDPATDMVQFDDNGTVTLTGPIELAKDITIDGNGHDVTIDGGSAGSVFIVDSGYKFKLMGLRLAGGYSTNGGALYINRQATVTVTNCLVYGNVARGGDGQNGANGRNAPSYYTDGYDGGNGAVGTNAFGGGIYNLGKLYLLNSTFASNSVVAGNGGGGGSGGNAMTNSYNHKGGDGGDGAAGGVGYGGAVYNAGTLLVSNCSFLENTVAGGSGGSGGTNGYGMMASYAGRGAAGSVGAGGAIFSGRSFVVVNSTFYGNRAASGSSYGGGSKIGVGQDAPSGVGSFGGAVYTGGGGITNCTFVSNSVTAGNGGDGGSGTSGAGGRGGDGGVAQGGAVFASNGVAVVHCTVAFCAANPGSNGVSGPYANASDPGKTRGSGICSPGGALVLMNSILASNGPGTNVYLGNGTLRDGGYNLSTDYSPSGNAKTTLKFIEPGIRGLAANGGPTNIAGGMLTVSLSQGSLAYKRIPASSTNFILAYDQRGAPRGSGTKYSCDVGAYEIGAPYIPDRANPFSYYPPTNGGSVNITVSPVGDEPLRYFWMLNGRSLGQSTTNAWNIASVTNENDGPYTLVVSNNYGKYTTPDVYIHFRPGIGTAPTNSIIAKAGSTATPAVSATGNTNDTSFRYQWRYSKKDASSTTNIPGGVGVAENYTNNSYPIRNLTTNDSGFYCVVISNTYGAITSSVCTLQVDQIVNDLTNQTVIRGSNVTFRVDALGSSSLAYAWYVNDVLDQGNVGREYVINSAATNGTYQVVVKDGTDVTMPSTKVYLTVVNSAPTNSGLVAFLTNASVAAGPGAALSVPQGASLVLSNTAAGGGLSYQWRFGGTPIAGGTNPVLALSAAKYSDGGSYDVVVTNLLGAAVNALTLNVLTMNPQTPAAIPGGYPATGVELAGTNAYVTGSDGTNGVLLSLDVSRPGGPLTNASLVTAGPALSFFVAGSNAYVACGAAGLEVVDVSNPGSPVPVATNALSYALSTFVTNGFAYVACGSNGLQILSVANPSSLLLVGQYTNVPANSVWVSGGNVLVAAGTNGLAVLKVDSFTNIVAASLLGDGSDMRSVTGAGNLAYLAASGAGVRVADLSAGRLVGTNTSARAARALAGGGSYLAVADGTNGVVLLDVSSPARPLLAAIASAGDVRDVALAGTNVYAATGTGLVVLDASLTLGLAPVIRSQPQSVSALPGSNAVFSVSVVGAEPLTYWWRSNDVSSVGAGTGGESSLTLTNVGTASARALYSVVISNAYGGATSSVAQLTLQACSYGVSPEGVSGVAASGASGLFVVSNSGACSFTVISSNEWIQALSTTGVGGASVYYTVAANTNTSARSGVVAVIDDTAGTTTLFTVDQVAYEPPWKYVYIESENPDSGATVGFTVSDLYDNTSLSTDPSSWVYAAYYSNSVVGFVADGTVNDVSTFLKWQTNGVDATTSPILTLKVTEDITIRAVYWTPFSFVAGTYYGLFLNTNTDADVSQDGSGSCKIVTTSKAKYTATLQVGNSRFAFSGQFDTNTGTAFKALTNRGGRIIEMGLQLVAADSDYLTGSVTNTTTNGYYEAALVADRAYFDGKDNVPAQTGAYTMVIPGDAYSTDQPLGDGYGTVKVTKTGVLTWAGALADGTKVTQSSILSKDGYWPMYVPLYSGGGSVLGWMHLISSNLVTDGSVDWGVYSDRTDFWPDSGLNVDLVANGALAWIKPANRKSVYYPDGFTIYRTNVWGLRYSAPAVYQQGFFSGTGELVLSGGDFENPLTNYIQVLDTTVKTTNKTSLSISRSAGTFSGKVYVPQTNITSKLSKGVTAYKTNVTQKAISFGGVIMTNTDSGLGVGYFLGTNTSGRVVFERKF